MPWAEHDYVSPPPVTSAPQYHPEFGYLSPTPQARRNWRVGVIAGVCGIMLGAVGVMTLGSASGPGKSGPAKVEANGTVGRAAASSAGVVDPAPERGPAPAAGPGTLPERTAPAGKLASPSAASGPSQIAAIAEPEPDEVKPAEPPKAVPDKTARAHKRKPRKERDPSNARNPSSAPYGYPADGRSRYTQQSRDNWNWSW